MKKILLILSMIMVFCLAASACSGSESEQGDVTKAPASGSTATATPASQATPTPAPATPTPEPQAEALVSISVEDFIYTSVVNVEYNGNTETWYKEQMANDPAFEVEDMEINFNVPNDGSEVEIKAVVQEGAPYKVTGWSGDATSDSETLKFVPSKNSVRLTIKVEPLFTENVAEGSTVTCSAPTEENSGARWGKDMLTDGDLNNRFSTGTLGIIDDETLQVTEPLTIDVDMGEAKAFNRVLLFPRTDTPDADGGVPNFPFGFDILVSNDGENFESVKSVDLEENVNDMVQTYDVGDQNARFIRINVRTVGNMAADEGTAATPYRVQLTELMAVTVK